MTYYIDDEITDSQLGKDCIVCDDELPPTSRDDADEIEEEFHDDPTRLYMLLTTTGDNELHDYAFPVDWTGKRGIASSNGPSDGLPGRDFGAVIFTHNAEKFPIQAKLQKSIIHETGHILGIGRADDDENPLQPIEVYSGDNTDTTPEEVTLTKPLSSVRDNSTNWSVMSRGWRTDIRQRPMNLRYIAFSIEELGTVEFDGSVEQAHSIEGD